MQTETVESAQHLAKFGYASGRGLGKSVTQGAPRNTSVTIDALCGQITTDSTSLAAEASATFVVNNKMVEAGDVIVTSIASNPGEKLTMVNVTAVSAGQFSVTVSNNNPAAGNAEISAQVINFVVIKGQTA